MSSWQMKRLALYLRLFQRPAMATRERALRSIAGPKGSAVPPTSLTDRFDVRQEMFGAFTWHTVQRPDVAAVVDGPARTVVYLHGGAYVVEITASHWAFIGELAQAGCRVVVPIYGLAPDHHVGEAVDFVTAVHERLLETTPAHGIAFAGDSAGGGLALAVAQGLVGRLPAPGRLVLVSPWLDVTLSNPGIRALERRDPWLSRVGLVEAGGAWVGDADGRDPRASPIHGVMSGLPPIEVVVGTRDLLYADVLLLGRRCAEAGVDCSLDVVKGAVHVFPLTPTPEGRATARRLVDLLSGG